jgi:stigma-specific protein Stig1
MRTKELVFLACWAACGKVEKIQADAAPDAKPDAAPDALVCTAPEMACSGRCMDTSMDPMHCGSCTQVCMATEACLASACVDKMASCAVIHQLDATKPTGVYMDANGTTFFCDMQHGLNGGQPPTQYDELGLGRYNATYAGFELVTGAMLTDPAVQAAFIAVYNFQLGALGLETFTSGNVCVTTSVAGGLRMQWGGSLLFAQNPTTLGMPATPVESPPTNPTAPPLAANFFATNPPADVTNCGDNNNPAFFFKRH